MLFSKDLLFIHVPKTGGMSVSEYLLKVLPPPIYYVHPNVDETPGSAGIIQIPGRRHESLEEARKIVAEYGFDVYEFPLILAVLRNPYAMEVSRYAYLQAGHPWDAGFDQDLALNEDFETFVLQSSYSGGHGTPIEGYFLLDGKRPDNLYIAKFEDLASDVRAACHRLGIERDVDFPWQNRSRHDDVLSYYTGDAEEAVYQRYRWVFDSGFYERIEVSNSAGSTGSSPYRHKLPIFGPVLQVGPSSGFWSDGWISDTLNLRVKVEQPVSALLLEGWLPPKFDNGNRFVLTINEQKAFGFFESGELKWRIPCRATPETRLQIELTASSTFCPQEEGVSEDMRHLAFILRSIKFEAQEAPGDGFTQL